MLFVFLISAATLDDSTPEGAWKLRAMQGASRLEQATDACEKALETAFVLHLTDDKLVRKANDDALFFHLVLTAGKDSVFDMAYVYSRKTNKMMGARITELPKKWMVAFMEADKIIVRSNAGCTYELDTKKPFAAQVVKTGAPNGGPAPH